MTSREPKRLRAGKAFEKLVKQDWHATAEGVVTSEKPIVKPTGRDGRIDLHVRAIDDGMIAVVEIKATDWDAMSEQAVRRNAARQARQIWSYIESQLADQLTVSPGVIFPKRPCNEGRLSLVDALFDERGIAVVWQDESLDERRARAEADLPFDQAGE